MSVLLLIGMFLAQTAADSRSQPGVATGIVRNADDTPAAGVRVAAMVAASGNDLTVPVLQSIARADENGRYRLEDIPPGRYYISAGRVDAPTYYPGVPTVGRATEVSIVPGATVTGLDFTVSSESTRPAPAPTAFIFGQLVVAPHVAASVSGVVTVENGTLQSAGSRVTAMARRLADDYATFGEIQGNGSFQLQLAEGDHRISISQPNGYTLKSMVSGTTDLLSQPLHVAATGSGAIPAEIQITLVRLPRVTIRGRVTDETTGQALTDGDAKVSSSAVTLHVPVGADGTFEIPGVFSGTYVLDIVAFGHARVLQTIEVVDKDLSVELKAPRLY